MERATITLAHGNIHNVTRQNVGRRPIALIDLFELQTAAEESYRQRRAERDSRCSGDCSYGGEG